MPKKGLSNTRYHKWNTSTCEHVLDYHAKGSKYGLTSFSLTMSPAINGLKIQLATLHVIIDITAVPSCICGWLSGHKDSQEATSPTHGSVLVLSLS